MPETEIPPALRGDIYYREQLTAALKVHPDIIQALLEEGRLYTMSEAEEVINRYMTRKV